jgi:hypothetical protein
MAFEGAAVRGVRFDWRWVVAIGVLIVLTNTASLPWPVTALVVGGAGAWLLAMGWRVWVRSGGPPERSKVTYWRGQRIEVGPPRRGPALPRWRDIGPAALYLIIGGVLLLAAITIAMRALGF